MIHIITMRVSALISSDISLNNHFFYSYLSPLMISFMRINLWIFQISLLFSSPPILMQYFTVQYFTQLFSFSLFFLFIFSFFYWEHHRDHKSGEKFRYTYNGATKTCIQSHSYLLYTLWNPDNLWCTIFASITDRLDWQTELNKRGGN